MPPQLPLMVRLRRYSRPPSDDDGQEDAEGEEQGFAWCFLIGLCGLAEQFFKFGRHGGAVAACIPDNQENSEFFALCQL